MGEKLNRREFLARTTATGIGLYVSSLPSLGSPTLPKASKSQKSRIVIISSEKVLVDAEKNTHSLAKMGMTSIGESNPRIDQNALVSMLGNSIKTLTGAKSDADGWKSLFKPSDVVGIKVNCMAGRALSSHPELITAIVSALGTAGVAPENIIIFDRAESDLVRAGYKPNSSDKGVIVRGTNDYFDAKATRSGDFNGRLSRIITEKITALINVPVLKQHAISGISGALKNHYGSIDNPSEHHGNGCTAIADLNATSAIKSKTRLIILDALKGQSSNGPGADPKFIWEAKTIITSTDPVAVDFQAWKMIEEQRSQTQLPTLGEPKWLSKAEVLDLGTNNPKNMDLIRNIVLT